MSRSSIIRLAALNLASIICFYLLYHTSAPKPYTNIAYFALMGGGAWWAGRQDDLSWNWVRDKFWQWNLIGFLLMVLFFVATWWGYDLLRQGRLAWIAGDGVMDTGQWARFARPWLEINIIVSLVGIMLVVLSLEVFYRGYTLELLSGWIGPGWALVASSGLSMLRGGGNTPATGLFEFTLSLVWGTIYLKAGLRAAVIAHLLWDILFIYCSP